MSDIVIKDYGTGDQPTGTTYTTARLQEQFEVLAFSAPFVVVRRKRDGKQGTLQFSHSPRIYFGWKADE